MPTGSFGTSSETLVGVVVIRDTRASFFRAYSPEDQLAQAAQAIQKLIEELKPGEHALERTVSSTKKEQLETHCPVSLGEAEEPLKISCGHIYCGVCFFNICQAEATKSGDFSISCLGDSEKCGKSLPNFVDSDSSH